MTHLFLLRQSYLQEQKVLVPSVSLFQSTRKETWCKFRRACWINYKYCNDAPDDILFATEKCLFTVLRTNKTKCPTFSGCLHKDTVTSWKLHIFKFSVKPEFTCFLQALEYVFTMM
jgi:hypothetical protein